MERALGQKNLNLYDSKNSMASVFMCSLTVFEQAVRPWLLVLELTPAAEKSDSVLGIGVSLVW